MRKKATPKRSSKSGITPPKAAYHSRSYIKTKSGMRRTAQGTPVGTIGSTGAQSAQAISMSPLFYDYQYSTPDKFYFPRDRAQANSIWRDIYRRDATVAITTDMYAELPWSKFDLEGIDDGYIRKVYEDMFNSLNLVPKLGNFTRDFYITGELILHAIFNSTKGYWERVISHNPDYVRVQGLGLAVEQPLMWLKPTPEMRRLTMSADPRVRKFLEVLPREMINAIRMNRELPLDALNTTYLPRLNTSNDPRGTSIYTRLYRVIMYEDFIVNSSLAVAQRNAAPVRLFKLGDPDGKWMPTDDDINQFMELLSLAETDPLAAVVTHPFVNVDYVGVADRALLISKEWDFIERLKLLAMGVSKAFLTGEVSFASAIAGLQVLMERLNSLRHRFEQDWLIPKLCTTVAEMHEFYEKPKNSLEHRIRVQKPGNLKPIVPKIKWFKSLEPTQDASVLGVWQQLHDKGILSKRTYASGAGVDLEVERRNKIEEQDYDEEKAEASGVAPSEGAPGEGPSALPPPEMPGASKKFSRRGKDERSAKVKKIFEKHIKQLKAGGVTEEKLMKDLSKIPCEHLPSDGLNGTLQLSGVSPEYSGHY